MSSIKNNIPDICNELEQAYKNLEPEIIKQSQIPPSGRVQRVCTPVSTKLDDRCNLGCEIYLELEANSNCARKIRITSGQPPQLPPVKKLRYSYIARGGTIVCAYKKTFGSQSETSTNPNTQKLPRKQFTLIYNCLST